MQNKWPQWDKHDLGENFPSLHFFPHLVTTFMQWGNETTTENLFKRSIFQFIELNYYLWGRWLKWACGIFMANWQAYWYWTLKPRIYICTRWLRQIWYPEAVWSMDATEWLHSLNIDTKQIFHRYMYDYNNLIIKCSCFHVLIHHISITDWQQFKINIDKVALMDS